MTIDVAGVVNKIWVTSGFLFQAVPARYIDVSGTCTFHISCGT